VRKSYLLKKKEKPYHIDYIFASNSFINNLKSCSVGKYNDWIKLSDHMPILSSFWLHYLIYI